jgi:hypothetical protein
LLKLLESLVISHLHLSEIIPTCALYFVFLLDIGITIAVGLDASDSESGNDCELGSLLALLRAKAANNPAR